MLRRLAEWAGTGVAVPCLSRLRPALSPLLPAVLAAHLAAPVWAAETIRVATFNAELSRDGPGLLLRDILKGEAADIDAALDALVAARPDVLALQGIDYDHGGATLAALARRLADRGLDLPYAAQPRPNSGVPTGRDIDGDGYRDGARDAQGFGAFPGQGGIALLSRWPVTLERDFTGLRWADLPGALIHDGDPAADIQRLSSTVHAVFRVEPPGAEPVRIATFHATPPVFDGPEDRNGRRNHDEAALWLRWIDGALGDPPEGRLVIAGDANLDPQDGDGRPGALTALLAHPRLQDPRPSDPEGARRATQGDANARHRGDPARDTADWDDGPGGPGNLRVDYVLPSADWSVTGAGITWPPERPAGADKGPWPRHGVVWVDLEGD